MQLETTGQRIRKAIKDSGIRINHLAEKLGVTPQQMTQIYKNTSGKSKYLPRIAEILNVSEKWLETGILNNRFTIIQMLDDHDILSLIDENQPLTMDELSQAVFDSVPIYCDTDFYKFSYKLKHNISEDIKARDILIFEMFLPLFTSISNKVILLYSKKLNSLIIGNTIVEASNKNLMISYKSDLNASFQETYAFSKGDFIIGVSNQVIIPNLQIRGIPVDQEVK